MGRAVSTVGTRDVCLIHVLDGQFHHIRMARGHVCGLTYIIQQVIELHRLLEVISAKVDQKR